MCGFRKVIACGWQMNDERTIEELSQWADVVILVGRPAAWLAEMNIKVPAKKLITIEIGSDTYGDFMHPDLLELLIPKIEVLL